MQRAEATRAFDGKADVYARNRFDYAPRAIDAIVAIAGLGESSAVADLGAGTGMLTRHFVSRVGRVFAIEPNDEMRALARSNLGEVDSLRVMKGTAEATGLPDQGVDAVIAGRAIHWFDPLPARAEMLRILRPGGWLIVVRTPLDGAGWAAALQRLRDACADQSASHDLPPRADDAAYFGGVDVVSLRFPCTARESWAQFAGRMRSLSFSPPPDDPRYGAFESAARAIFDEAAEDGTLSIRYSTEVLMREVTPLRAKSGRR
jgi:SAM-dependent methyltransferase